MARAFQSWNRHKSYALVFLDLREAFYRVCRQLLCSDELSEESIAAVCQRLSLPADAFRRFRDHLLADSLLYDAQALQQALPTVLCHTWFRLQPQQDIAATTLGSRPEDNLADVMFFYVFAAVLAEVREAAASDGLLTHVSWREDMRGSIRPLPATAVCGSLPLHDVVWMDDLSLLLSSETAAGLLPVVAKVAGLLIDSCLQHGLMPNLDICKTETLVSVRGVGAKATRARHLSDASPSIPGGSCLWPDARIHVVAIYKHIGGLIHHKAGLDAEIRARIPQTLAWTAQTGTCAPPWGKVPLFQSLVLSCLFYGNSTWAAVARKTLAPLHRCYQEMCRSPLRKHFKSNVPHLSDDRALGVGAVLGSLAPLSPPYLLCVLCQNGCTRSLDWLHKFVGGPDGEPRLEPGVRGVARNHCLSLRGLEEPSAKGRAAGVER